MTTFFFLPELNDIAPIKPNSWSESGYPQYEIGLIGRPSGLVLYNPLDSPAKYCRKEEWCNGKIRFSSTPTKRSTKFALTIEVNVKTLDTTSPDVITAVRFKQGNFSLGVYRLEFFTPRKYLSYVMEKKKIHTQGTNPKFY